MADLSKNMWSLALQLLKAYFNYTMPMATKLGRVMTYHDGLSPVNSHDPLIKLSCKVR